MQWIHIDPERAGRESPSLATIAHGFPDPVVAQRFAYDLL